jgi:bifunctional UDP-N-acetylglucosamine pyrophosphorylase / glucosamine-1-phosphate N-acetyltransferase
MSELVAVILAAGKGTRMKSKLPKVLHKIGGKPMLQHVLDAADAAGAARKVVVVGHEAELVEAMVGEQAQMALQAEQLGTGHAVMQTEAVLKDFCGTVMIICGDTPLLEAAELKKFYEGHVASQAAATVLTAFMDDPAGYGRIIRDADGNVLGIVEEKDAVLEQTLQYQHWYYRLYVQYYFNVYWRFLLWFRGSALYSACLLRYV